MQILKKNTYNILLSGGTGFLGRNLINQLNKQHKWFNLGRNKNTECENIYWNLTDDIDINYLPEKIDIVIHAASIVGLNSKFSNTEYYDINVKSTLQLLELSAKINISHFIYISSGAIYGESEKEWEENDNCDPKNIYASSKHLSELLCKQYEKLFQVSILRLFFFYGSNQKGRLLFNLIEKIYNNKIIELPYPDHPQINPIHISDTVNVIEMIINQQIVGTFNIAGNEKITLKECCNIISQLIDNKVQLIFSYNHKNTFNILGSNLKLFKLLNYYPKTTLLKGIQEACRCFNSDYKQ